MAALAVAACSDSPSGAPRGSPDGALTVSITARMTQTDLLRAPVDPFATLYCELVLHGKATGPAGTTAQWGRGVFRFFTGLQRDVPTDSFTVSADEIGQSWDSPTITSGAVMQSRWRLSAGVPFAITADLEYGAAGSTQLQKASFAASCPAVAPGTAGPSITNVSVSPASGELQAGQDLAVTYTVSAPAGLWETSVLLTGAAAGEYRVRETFQTAETRTETVRIPINATLTGPLRVYVRAADSFLRIAQVEVPNTVAIVDHTAPTLLRVAIHAGTTAEGNHITGQFGAGDTISAYWYGQDDNALKWVGWSIDGAAQARDSVPVAAVDANPLRIPFRAEWADASAVRMWVADRGGNHSVELVSAPGAFRVFPVRTRPARLATTSGVTNDAVIDERRGLVYVAIQSEERIAVLSLATMTFGPSIAVPGNAKSIDLSVSGDSLLVVLDDVKSVGVVDLQHPGSAMTVVRLSSYYSPTALRVAADGRVLLAILADFASVDLATGRVQVLADDGGGAGTLGRTRDRSLVMFVGLCRFDYIAGWHTVTPCRHGAGEATPCWTNPAR